MLEHDCNLKFSDYIHRVGEMRPDYLFVITKCVLRGREPNSTEQDAFVKQMSTRTQTLQNLVTKRMFILDALPRPIPRYVTVLNSKLSNHQSFNQTELFDQMAVEFTRSALRQVINSCEKCSLISYDNVFGSGSSFRVFDEKTKVSFFTEHYMSPFGLREVAPIYEEICASF
ncbi:unnamed protein product [Nippostrongylus brasiliensis]|uniref:SGNH domain-containing protein n=1 Tax=Nippostrongylus brasiliensis TaxID=27835 RepID=A0A0N4XZN3_NIPBR|nr:unnamed protein product [Nippostrongylus brasiliensis]